MILNSLESDMHCSLIWQKFFRKYRKIILLVIFLISFDFIRISLWAQQSPEPKEGFMAGQPSIISNPKETGLLFYLSGNNGFTADFAAGGQVLPNYLKDVTIIPGGARGPGFSAEDSQLLTYWASGNIYAQRGTLSFFWRSRYPVGQICTNLSAGSVQLDPEGKI